MVRPRRSSYGRVCPSTNGSVVERRTSPYALQRRMRRALVALVAIAMTQAACAREPALRIGPEAVVRPAPAKGTDLGEPVGATLDWEFPPLEHNLRERDRDVCPEPTAAFLDRHPFEVCRSSTCGNGTIERSCDTAAAMTGTRVPWTEECDGTALGGATCESLGFAGGALACASWCAFDSTGCDACAGESPRVSSCTRAKLKIDGNEDGDSHLALAATDTEVAVAYERGRTEDDRVVLGFARFDRQDLSAPTFESDCSLGTVKSGGAHALARSKSGWLIASHDLEGSIAIRALDERGALRADPWRVRGTFPRLVRHPELGTLFLWDVSGGVAATLVDDKGAMTQTPVPISGAAVVGAAPIDGGFLVASTSRAGVILSRLGVGLAVLGRRLVATNATEPVFVSDDRGGGRLVYRSSAGAESS